MPLILPSHAIAQLDPWEFEVYPYATLSRGVAELETDNAVVANGHSHGGKALLPEPSAARADGTTAMN